jgi:2-(1,2-epoxy-1,2-dihydrophenyl)acetyl-CoA isomerase
MGFETIKSSVADRVARITLNRPEKRNGFNTPMHQEVRDALTEVAREKPRALLLTGSGSAFCSGQDLSERVRVPGHAPVDLGASIENNYKPLCLALRSLPVPVVAAVNGVAAGAGANIALACDLVIARKSASFVQSFCKLGLVPDSGGTWTLPRLVGGARALGITLLGDSVSAEQAVAWGMIWRCVEDETFDTEVEALLARLAASPTLGLVHTKAALYAGAHFSFEESLNLERDYQRLLGKSADYAEGVAAFNKKRPPLFIGS